MATEGSFLEATVLTGGSISTDSSVINTNQTKGRSEEKQQERTVFAAI